MAWNPDPEVQVARDAANRLGKLAGSQTVMCVVVYVTREQLGYASYGMTPKACGVAKKIGDALYAETERLLENIKCE